MAKTLQLVCMRFRKDLLVPQKYIYTAASISKRSQIGREVRIIRPRHPRASCAGIPAVEDVKPPMDVGREKKFPICELVTTWIGVTSLVISGRSK